MELHAPIFSVEQLAHRGSVYGEPRDSPGDDTRPKSQSARSAIPRPGECAERAGIEPVLRNNHLRPFEHTHCVAAATPAALSAIHERQWRMELPGRFDLPCLRAQSGKAVLAGI